MKTTKLRPGYYTFTYNKHKVEIVKVVYPHNGQVMWYSQIDGGNVDDHVFTKKKAIEDAIYVIDHPEEL